MQSSQRTGAAHTSAPSKLPLFFKHPSNAALWQHFVIKFEFKVVGIQVVNAHVTILATARKTRWAKVSVGADQR